MDRRINILRMSKIGKKLIEIPNGVEFKIDGDSVWAKGPKGELKKTFHDSVGILVEGNTIVVKNKKADSTDTALWGLVRSLLANMIKGVSEGFEKNLEFEGVGYKVNVKGDDLELNLGYSHSILVKAPKGISFKVEKNVIKISGVDKELIGHVAAEIKSKRPPEPYKGKGIKYAGEVIRRKAGKKAAATA